MEWKSKAHHEQRSKDSFNGELKSLFLLSKYKVSDPAKMRDRTEIMDGKRKMLCIVSQLKYGLRFPLNNVVGNLLELWDIPLRRMHVSFFIVFKRAERISCIYGLQFGTKELFHCIKPVRNKMYFSPKFYNKHRGWKFEALPNSYPEWDSRFLLIEGSNIRLGLTCPSEGKDFGAMDENEPDEETSKNLDLIFKKDKRLFDLSFDDNIVNFVFAREQQETVSRSEDGRFPEHNNNANPQRVRTIKEETTSYEVYKAREVESVDVQGDWSDQKVSSEDNSMFGTEGEILRREDKGTLDDQADPDEDGVTPMELPTSLSQCDERLSHNTAHVLVRHKSGTGHRRRYREEIGKEERNVVQRISNVQPNIEGVSHHRNYLIDAQSLIDGLALMHAKAKEVKLGAMVNNALVAEKNAELTAMVAKNDRLESTAATYYAQQVAFENENEHLKKELELKDAKLADDQRKIAELRDALAEHKIKFNHGLEYIELLKKNIEIKLENQKLLTEKSQWDDERRQIRTIMGESHEQIRQQGRLIEALKNEVANQHILILKL